MLKYHRLTHIMTILILAGLLLAACQPAPPPTMDETQVANSVNATLTSVAASAPTATSVPPPPTAVPTTPPEPTPAAPSPTPTLPPVKGDPALELGTPDGVDTFDSPVNFAPLETKCFKSEITSGQFVMAAKGLAGIYCWATSWPTIQDFYIEATSIMPDVCSAGDNFGLLFRSPSSTDGYLLGLSCAGEYSLKRVMGGGITELISPTASDAILVGAGQVNRIGVVAFSGNYYLYANGKYLSYATDFTFLGPGDIGFYVNAASTNPFVSRYEEYKVWTLEDAYYPSSAPAPVYPPVEPEAPASGAPTVTATSSVNVRSGPGTDYPVLGVASVGATAEVTGTSPDGAWYIVKIPSTVSPAGTGWVSADYVTLSNPGNVDIPVVQPAPPPPPVTPPPPPAGVAAVTALEPVNIRVAPAPSIPAMA